MGMMVNTPSTHWIRETQETNMRPLPGIHGTAASREAMSAARLPLQYRDSCAGLLIPLNKCRHESSFLPWKCEVSYNSSSRQMRHWGECADRASRPRDIATRNANTKNSRRGWPRWTRSGQPRPRQRAAHRFPDKQPTKILPGERFVRYLD